MSADPRRAELDRALLDWMREPTWACDRTRDDARFESLALRLFEFQYEHCPPYRRLCNARDQAPGTIARWQDVPPVPTGAFKELRIASFEPERECAAFRTSGTSTARRGTLHLDTLALYEASALAALRTLLFSDLPLAGRGGRRTTLRVLAASPREAGDSSLSHMFGCLLAAHGDTDSGYDLRDGALDPDGLLRACSRARGPVALLGTAFAFVHLLDALSGRELPLPAGSRIMETGGSKGRAREVPPAELHAALAGAFGLPADRVVNQYGMTELGSQFYDSVIADSEGPRRKLGPPWARVRLVDPTTGADARPGEPGVIHVHDLANTGSVAAIQTADLGRGVAGSPPGFEVLGRLAGAEERGCSIAADAMLGGAA